jgi:hypothetical protein
MMSVRARRAVLVGAIVAAWSSIAVVGCSSDKPAAGGGGTTAEGGPATDANRSTDGRDDANGEGGLDDASVDQFANGACLDDRPAKTDAEAGPVCPAAGTCSAACNRILDRYKLGVAQVAITCLLDLPSCANPTDVIACVDTALGAACLDPTSKGYCTPLVKPCDPNAGGPGSAIDQTGCESFANGLSASGRGVFETCVQSKIDAGTCPMEIVACADEIRQ